ncbi:MAG: hypothetical protein PHV75_01015 [Victivallaceae bacterium]|nr:hypothetical protein [Victivallaceae bacterium]MDD3117095.1 hypothetical protein [Victivallaceae bacterium]MDD3703195.1 hypothetical protein [Victivallaceae bacterium]MDD4317076.1 hypothetical protein [Victivallaceae bacterium]MDD5664221.1 hypothetical protein [Victivallaceae bacterium]
MKLSKSILTLFLCGTAILLCAQSLESYIPADATTVASFKLRDIYNLPAFKSEDQKIQQYRSQLDKFNFTGDELPQQVVMIHGRKYKNPVFLAPTTIAPSKIKDKLNQIVKEYPEISYSKISNKGFDGYKITAPKQKSGIDSIYIYYLSDKVIALITDESVSPGELKAGSAPANPLINAVKNSSSKELFRIVNSGFIPDVLEQNAQGFEQLMVSVSKTNEIGDSFLGYAEIEFDQAEKAGQATMTFQMLFNMMALSQLQNNTDLSSDIANAVVFQTKGKKTVINVNLTAALIEKLKNEFKKKAKAASDEKLTLAN